MGASYLGVWFCCLIILLIFLMKERGLGKGVERGNKSILWGCRKNISPLCLCLEMKDRDQQAPLPLPGPNLYPKPLSKEFEDSGFSLTSSPLYGLWPEQSWDCHTLCYQGLYLADRTYGTDGTIAL